MRQEPPVLWPRAHLRRFRLPGPIRGFGGWGDASCLRECGAGPKVKRCPHNLVDEQRTSGRRRRQRREEIGDHVRDLLGLDQSAIGDYGRAVRITRAARHPLERLIDHFVREVLYLLGIRRSGDHGVHRTLVPALDFA